MGNHASFWDNPELGDRPVVRHAPDDHNYHYADGRQLERMRSGVLEPVVVPRARRDGASSAFDATVAAVVHVDPDAPDGGAIVDLSDIDQGALNVAMSQASYPHQVFYKLGVSPRLLTEEQPPDGRRGHQRERVNPLMPMSYVVPAAGADGTQQSPLYAIQQEQAVQPTPPSTTPQIANAPQLVGYGGGQGGPPPGPPPYYPAPPYYPPPPQPQAADPAMVQLLARMSQGIDALVTQASQPKNGHASGRRMGPPPSLITRPLGKSRSRHQAEYETPDDKQVFEDVEDAEDEAGYAPPMAPPRRDAERRRNLPKRVAAQHLRDLEEDVQDEEEREGLIVGFETLNIPYVSGPLPAKPKKQVFFEFDGFGKQAARFHEVIIAQNLIVLVYDTRYEEGTQYLPPDLGEKVITLHVPGQNKTFNVSSMGMTYSHGVFDHIVLIRHDETARYEDEE